MMDKKEKLCPPSCNNFAFSQTDTMFGQRCVEMSGDELAGTSPTTASGCFST